MNYQEFTKRYYVNRKNTNCAKWDAPMVKDTIPMWVADADFKAPEKVVENLEKRIKHGSYGYSFLPTDYLDAYIKWNKEISGITYKKDWVRYSKGAVDGLTHVICALTKQKDAILMCTPIYHHFFFTLDNTNRKLVTSPLINNDNYFTMDYKDIEEKIVKNKVKLFIFCSPCNPVGRVWKKEEIEKLLEITHKHNVIVVSDEVHSELIMPGFKFIPTLSFKKYQNDVITLNAESKTFSIALFQHSHIVCPNKEYRDKIDDFQKFMDITHPNGFNGLASYYCFKYGKDWLSGFNDTIYHNYKYLCKELSPYVDILPLEGSYLAFVDFSKVIKGKTTAFKYLKDKCHVYTNAGEAFSPGYEKWARINLATSLSNVKKAVKQIKDSIK